MGYATAAGIYAASEVGASHERERLFILGVGNTDGQGLQRRRGECKLAAARGSIDADWTGGTVVFPPAPDDADGWRSYLESRPDLEPAVFGSDDELADRVDRVRMLGNGVVPKQAEFAFLDLWRSLRGS